MSAMHDWTKSGWFITANRDMQVLVGADRHAENSINYITKDDKKVITIHHHTQQTKLTMHLII